MMKKLYTRSFNSVQKHLADPLTQESHVIGEILEFLSKHQLLDAQTYFCFHKAIATLKKRRIETKFFIPK